MNVYKIAAKFLTENSRFEYEVMLVDNASTRTIISDEYFPDDMSPNYPATWRIVHFELAEYSPPQEPNPQTHTLRNGSNGITVTDGMVGGNTVCGNGLDYWSEWVNQSYPGSRHLNV